MLIVLTRMENSGLDEANVEDQAEGCRGSQVLEFRRNDTWARQSTASRTSSLAFAANGVAAGPSITADATSSR